MKKLIYILIAVIGITFTGCEPDEVTINELTPYDGTLIAAELEVPSASSFLISQTTDVAQGNETTQAVILNWSSATGDNDGNIMYFLQMDIVGNKFESAVTIPLGQTGTTELSRSFTFGELNSAVNKLSSNLIAIASALSVNFNELNNLEIRLESVLGASIAKAYSQPITISVNPYFSGLSNELNLKGLALADAVKLTVADGMYAGRVNLTKNIFRIFAEPSTSNISYNYAYFQSNGYTIDPLLENANDTAMNFKFTGNEGPWDISIDTKAKTITLVEVTIPDNLYIVGSNTDPAWKPTISPKMNLISEGVFALVIQLSGPSDGFKFIPTNIDYTGDWGEDPANLGSIIQDGEQNLTGYDAGKYLVVVDYNKLTYKVTAVNNLYMVGKITTPEWTPSASPKMVEASLGIYSLVVDLADGAEFKFLPTNASFDGDWGADKNNPGSIIQDGESNLIGYPAGKYVVSVNFNTLSFKVSSVSAIPTNLYLVGDHSNWSPGSSPIFTKINPGVFQITQALAGGKGFKFLPTNANFDNDFGENKTSKGVLEQKDEQNVSVTTDGTYKITVDFNKGNISVIPAV